LYDSWARRIAAGEWLGNDVFFMGPLYPYFLAVVYFLFGPSQLAAVAIQFLIGSVSCALVYLVARKLAGAHVAVIAALILAFYGPLIFFEGLLLPEVLAIVTSLGWLYLLVRGGTSCRPRAFILIGVILGLSVLVRASALIFLGGIALSLVSSQGVRNRQVWRRLAGLIVGTCLIVAPVTARNWVVGHDLVLVTSNGGLNFFIGNGERSNGLYVNLEELRMVGGDPDADWTGRHYAEQTVGRSLRPSEVSAFWLGKSLRFIRSHLGTFIGRALKKIVLFWNSYEIPQIEDYYIWRTVSPSRLPLITFALVGPLGIAGMLLTARRKEFYPLQMFVVLYMISVCAFFVTARYRVQVVPVLSIFSAYTICWVIHSLRQGLAIKVVGVVVLTLLAGVAMGRAPLAAMGIRPSVESWYAHFYKGTKFLDEPGGLETALHELNIAARLNPTHPETFNNLGLAYDKRGMPREALAAFQRAIQVDSTYVEAWYNLAFFLQRDADYRSAIRLYLRVLELQPYFPSGHFNLGICYFRLGQMSHATTHLQMVTELQPHNAEAHNQLGIVLAEQGNLAGALAEFSEALRIRPEYSQAKANLDRVRQLKHE
jgi:tetratricopeptide (TPR) repeat protein